jgi:hypothetical protein
MKSNHKEAEFLFPENPIDKMSGLVLISKTELADLKERLHDRSAMLNKAKNELEDLQIILFGIRQKELFNGEGTESFEQLKDLLGIEYASKVVKAFAGTTLYIPKNVIAGTNYNRIRKEYHDGSTYRELGKRYGYTERYIRNIIHSKKG